MTTIAVLADPPEPGVVFPALSDSDLLTAPEAAELYEAMLADLCGAIDASGAELLVNYRDTDQLSVAEIDGQAAIEAALGGVVDTNGTRFEVQVGSTFDARVGNTVTHLLKQEAVATAAVATPSAALLGRQHVDSAAMKLRSSDVVLGPSAGGRVTYAGFGEPIDFEGAFATPAIETLVARANDAGLATDFLPSVPVLEQPADLATVVPQLSARDRAGRRVPARTMETLDSLGIEVVEEDGEATVRRP